MRRQVGHVTNEGEYFHQLDAELIEAGHRRAEHEQALHCMQAASQIDDPKILGSLEKLGFNAETVSLICLVPLVRVAWADGVVRGGERDHVLAIANLHGVKEDSRAHRLLLEWLERPPSEEFFEGALDAINAVLRTLPAIERQGRRRALLQCCADVAAAAGWHLKPGGPERKIIENIRKHLELAEQPAASGGKETK